MFTRFAFLTEIIFKFGTFLYFVSGIAFLVYPLYMYFFKGELVTINPSYLPGIDETTVKGYIMITIYHIVLLSVAVVGATASDCLFTMLIANTPVLSLLIEMEVEQLNDALASENTDKLLVKSKFRNMLFMHREMTELVTTIF